MIESSKKTKNEFSLSLWTDLYQITSAAAFFINGVNPRVSFELYVPKLPRNRNYLIAVGLEHVVEYLSEFRFTDDDIEFLRSLPQFCSTPKEFFSYLKEMRFGGDLWALPEGTPFFPREPILRITAPLIEAQIVESYILNAINYPITVASKAARIVESANHINVIDFGFRRAPTPHAAHFASRAAFIAGFEATSNLEGARRYGIPAIGIIPYSFVLPFESEQEALKKYARAFPNGALVLIDTLKPAEATREVIACGEKLRGVRISSKELLKLSRNVREMLNSAGHQDTKIIASGELDEVKIHKLVQANAPIDYFGVGAGLVSPAESETVEGTYKLVEIEDNGRIRYPEKFLSGRKILPGKKQILRKVDDNGKYCGDCISKAGEVPQNNEIACIRKIMERGKLISPLPSIKEIRKYCLEEIRKLPEELRNISGRYTYPVRISPSLRKIRKTIFIKKKR